MNGAESSGSGIDSGRTDSNSLASCKLESDLDDAVGELDDKVPAAIFHAPSKTVFHENGAVSEASVADGVGTSDSGSSAGLVDGSAAKVDSLGSVRSDTGAGLDNRSGTNSG